MEAKNITSVRQKQQQMEAKNITSVRQKQQQMEAKNITSVQKQRRMKANCDIATHLDQEVIQRILDGLVERQELRNRILVQQMKVPEAVALKLGRLLQLMDAFPDFNMGGLFILGKSKLVSIASFVATYLVILLQFNLSDPTEAAVPQETTNTTVHPTC
ncbi:uncharacterized protein [Panulirus ornatus]|uniref:uncharacterized protein isoform X2 n=1 Tax=Panulirus ornatus TaxID=150431 RepID=UPI003A859D42